MFINLILNARYFKFPSEIDLHFIYWWILQSPQKSDKTTSHETILREIVKRFLVR